jgi:hypothetical protein
VDAINDDLLFPAETERGAFSLGYQYFAMMPILLVAEQGMTLGKNLYAERDGIIGKVITQRLVPAIAGDQKVIELIQTRAGAEQLPVKFVNLPMLTLYAQRFPDAFIEQAANAHIRFLHTHPQTGTQPVSLTAKKQLPTLHDLFSPEYGGLVKLIYPLGE